MFGVELEFLLQREAGGTDIEPGIVPSVISRCLYEVEQRGLSEVGICKHSDPWPLLLLPNMRYRPYRWGSFGNQQPP